MAVALLALVVALSTSATAAFVVTGAQIKDKSITAKDLKKGAVKSLQVKNRSLKGKDLKKGTVTGKEIKDHSITGSDVKAGSITSTEIKDGSVSSSDIQNGTITESKFSETLVKVLTSGAAGFEVVSATSAPASLPLLAPVSVSATCPAGKVAISANAYWLGNTDVAPPQVRRTAPGAFLADTTFVVGLLGGEQIQIQLTCVNAA